MEINKKGWLNFKCQNPRYWINFACLFTGTVILLLVMGFTGSIARILFVAPLLEHDEKNNKLVPPVYAVRPLAFVITYISFAWFVGQDSGVLLGFFPYELSAPPPTNIGWVIGISGAVIVAGFQFIKLRR